MKLPLIAVIVASVAIIGGSLGIMNIQDDKITYIPKNILTLQTGETNMQITEASFDCGKSFNEIQSETPFHILTPKILPEGYSLRGADNAAPGRILLKYADGNVCGENAKRLDDGVIEIVIAYPPDGENASVNGQKFIDSYAEKYEKNNIKYKSLVTKNNLYIIGTEAGIGKSLVIDENGKTIHEEQYDDPARVYVVDESGKTAYVIRAFLPFGQMLQIAQSLS